MNIDSLFKIDVKLYNLLLTPKIWMMRWKYRDAIRASKKNSELLAKERRSDVIYICGNGPSLRKVDLKDIDCDYLVVNDFYRFEKKNPENPPKYYMILDDAYIMPSLADRYNGVFNPGFETTYILTGALKKNIDKDFPDKENIYYFCPWGRLYSSKKKNDFVGMRSRPWNCVCEAILFSLYMGYKDIRLLGCDYSVFAANAHFYDVKQAHPKLREMLFKYSFTTHVHYEIAKYAEKRGAKITNLTKETLLDAYVIDENSPY